MTSSTDATSHWNRYEGEAIPSTLPLYPPLLDHLQPHHRVLDIGCGYGRIGFELLARGQRHITGVDTNASGILAAQAKARALAPDGVHLTFRSGDARALSEPDGSYDVCILQAVLTAIAAPPQRLAVLREAHRVLVPGGHLYLAVFAQSWHLPHYKARYRQGLSDTGEEGSFRVLDERNGDILYVAHHYSEKELVALLDAADFTITAFSYERFTTRSGNQVNGMVAMVQRPASAPSPRSA